MASRRVRGQNGHAEREPTPTPDVDGAAITEAQYPKGTPTNDDGSVATSGEVTIDEARAIGALDAESALNNKRHQENIARKRAGGTMSWNEADPLIKYDQILAAYGTSGLMLFIIGEPEREGGQETHFSPVAAIHFQDGQSLYDYVLRVLHKVNPPRQYTVRCRQGKDADRGVCRIKMPDTTAMISASANLPWTGPQVPGGYPQPVQPQLPYGYAHQPYGYGAQQPVYGPQPGYGYAPHGMQQPPPQPHALPAAPAQPQPPAHPPAPSPEPVSLGQSQGPAPQSAPQAQPQQPQYQPHPAAMQPQGYPQQPGFAQPPPPPYGYPTAQPALVQPPPQTADPAANAWMGAMYQMLQQVTGKLDTRSEMEKLAAFVDDVRSGRVSLQGAPALPPQFAPQQHAPAPAPAAAPAPTPVAHAPQVHIPAGYAMLMTPTGQQILVPASQVGLSGIQPPPAPQAPAPTPEPVDPLAHITRSVEMVGTLAALMDRVRGVAPAVQAAAPAPPVEATESLAKRPFDTMQMGDMTLAVRPETGDIHWLGTLLGNAPKVFGFAERFTSEAAKTVRAHELSKAVQTGRLPPQYVPVPTQGAQPQVPVSAPPPPAFVPQQPQPPVFSPPPVAAHPQVAQPQPQVRQQTVAPKPEEDSPIKSIFQ